MNNNKISVSVNPVMKTKTECKPNALKPGEDRNKYTKTLNLPEGRGCITSTPKSNKLAHFWSFLA